MIHFIYSKNNEEGYKIMQIYLIYSKNKETDIVFKEIYSDKASNFAICAFNVAFSVSNAAFLHQPLL